MIRKLLLLSCCGILFFCKGDQSIKNVINSFKKSLGREEKVTVFCRPRVSDASGVPGLSDDQVESHKIAMEAVKAKLEQYEDVKTRVGNSFNRVNLPKEKDYTRQYLLNAAKMVGYGMLGFLGTSLFPDALYSKFLGISVGLLSGLNGWKKIRFCQQAEQEMNKDFNRIRKKLDSIPKVYPANLEDGMFEINKIGYEIERFKEFYPLTGKPNFDKEISELSSYKE